MSNSVELSYWLSRNSRRKRMQSKGSLLHLVDWDDCLDLSALVACNQFWSGLYGKRRRTFSEIEGKKVSRKAFNELVASGAKDFGSACFGEYAYDGDEFAFHASFGVGNFHGSVIREHIVYFYKASAYDLLDDAMKLAPFRELVTGYGYVTSFDGGDDPIDYSQGIETVCLASLVESVEKNDSGRWAGELNTGKAYLRDKIRDVFEVNIVNSKVYNSWIREFSASNKNVGDVSEICPNAYLWTMTREQAEKARLLLAGTNMLIDR